ncbi:MFS transporter [Longispora albida]|uniref:MFS transporter n=1 Tax=Longispora albida TaxID=203523 RepID=UPI0003768CBD|nr:MFS transporter [Longispora albida]
MFINGEFRRLWAGQAVSTLGDTVFTTSLLLWVGTVLLKGSQAAPAVSSAFLALVALTVVVAAPVAGVLVDRWDKRQVMLRADLARFLLVGTLAVVALLPRMPIALTLSLTGILLVAATVAGQLFGPARLVLIGDIVPAELRGRAASYSQASAAVATILGPAVAVPLLVFAGAGWAFAVNAVSFLVSYTMIWFVRVDSPGRERDRLRKEILVGLRFVAGHRVLRSILVTGMVVMLGAGCLTALDVYFVSENLRAGAGWFGAISAVLGAGMLAGSLSAGFLGDRFGHAKVQACGLIAAGTIFFVYSRMSEPWPAIVLIGLFGVAAGALETVFTPLLLEHTPREYQGRVFSVFTPAYRLSSMLSVALAGAVAGAIPIGARYAGFGRIDAIFAVTALLLVVAGVYAAIVARD